eukprot:2345193-Rhodomonas_salina.4
MSAGLFFMVPLVSRIPSAMLFAALTSALSHQVRWHATHHVAGITSTTLCVILSCCCALTRWGAFRDHCDPRARRSDSPHDTHHDRCVTFSHPPSHSLPDLPALSPSSLSI